jgi:hypothetical protein
VILNLRATNGAGKSTAMFTLLSQYAATPIYGALGRKLPEAYQLIIPNVREPVFVIGPYTTQCGGCDRITKTNLTVDLIRNYQPKGHVVFEGLLISTYYGHVGSLLERYGSQSVILFLSTTVAVCIARVNARRAERNNNKPFDPRGLIQKHQTIERLKDKMTRRGMRVIDVSSNEAPATIVGLLCGAGIEQSTGRTRGDL